MVHFGKLNAGGPKLRAFFEFACLHSNLGLGLLVAAAAGVRVWDCSERLWVLRWPQITAGGRIIGRRDMTDKVWLVPRFYPDLSKIPGNRGTLERFFGRPCPRLSCTSTWQSCTSTWISCTNLVLARDSHVIVHDILVLVHNCLVPVQVCLYWYITVWYKVVLY
jgi:hypothetical protein